MIKAQHRMTLTKAGARNLLKIIRVMLRNFALTRCCELIAEHLVAFQRTNERIFIHRKERSGKEIALKQSSTRAR